MIYFIKQLEHKTKNPSSLIRSEEVNSKNAGFSGATSLDEPASTAFPLVSGFR